MSVETLMRALRVALAAIAPALVLGCAGKPAQRADRPAASAQNPGVLMSWDSTRFPPGATAQELLREMERTWMSLPADTRVESRQPRRLVLTLDLAKAGNAMAGKASDPRTLPPTPVRMVFDAVAKDGVQYLNTRQYYLGGDPAMLAEIESNVKRAREAGNLPPK